MIRKIVDDDKRDIENLIRTKMTSVLKSIPNYSKAYLEEDKIKALTKEILEQGSAFVDEDGEAVKAFVFYYKLDELFYYQKGCYTPEWGYYGPEGYNPMELLTRVYEDMNTTGHTHHAISEFLFRKELIESLTANGYGSRCMDGMKVLDSKMEVKETAAVFRLLEVDEYPKMETLFEAHEAYMTSMPIGLWASGFDDFHEELKEEGVKVWSAWVADELIAIVKTTDAHTGGCDSIVDEDTLGIQTTQIDKRYEGQGIAGALIRTIFNWAMDEGYKKVVVDYETINPAAHRFWPRYFDETIVSLTRYIG